MWLEKLSMILLLGWNSGLIGSNKGKISLNLLSISMMWPSMRSCCHLVKELSERGWGRGELSEVLSISDLRIWLVGSVCTLSWDLLLSFWRWRWIGISPTITSRPKDGAVLKTLSIHIATHLWSFPNDFRGYNRGVLE